MTECSKCNSTFSLMWIKDLDICPKCAYEIYSDFEDLIDNIDETIRTKYNMSSAENITLPVNGCTCNNPKVIPFDYYTPQVTEFSYGLILCCLCRGCQGYRLLLVNDVSFPIEIRSKPKHVGLDVEELTKISLEYIV